MTVCASCGPFRTSRLRAPPILRGKALRALPSPVTSRCKLRLQQILHPVSPARRSPLRRPYPARAPVGASAGRTFGLCRGLCTLMGITKSIVCLWAAVIKSTPSRWAAPLRRRRVTNDAGHALPQCHDWTLRSPRVRGLELAIHKDCGAVGESLSLEGLSYRNVVATAHAIQSTKHLGNCGD